MTGHVIVRKDCTVILNNVNITAGAHTQLSPYNGGNVGTAPLSIQDNATCTVLLAAESDNYLTGASDISLMLNSAGLSVENTINATSGEKHLASVIIDSVSGVEQANWGRLEVLGKTQSAAIGGSINRASGNITINGGIIKATAGSWSTALGDGDSERSRADYSTWSCVGGDDKVKDTCQPASIIINDGNIWAEGKDAAPAIGTSDELSGDKDGGNGSGVKNRVWNGQTITINGGTTICVGGGPSNASYTSMKLSRVPRP
ncbi:hypothetical protein M2145_002431 [Lachnospiraceae bacterium PF1-21]|uniref:hypothetical protein n=1 Tax=Ohessyouella blattaphilus TaxID=2949333 RepID=UPI003E245871